MTAIPTPPLVSIVTPTLNSAAFLAELLACVEGQTYANLEHVVVDGRSTDGTLDLLERTDPARHTYFSRSDRSMYEAINFGIGHSHGEIVGCLNADDLYLPDTVAAVVDFFETHPAIDIVYGDQLTLFTRTASFDFYLMENAYADPWGHVLVYISQPSVFVRRRVFSQVGLFDPTLRAAGDFDFWFRAFKSGARFRRLPRLLTIVRFHGENLSLGSTWQTEHEELKRRYLPEGAATARAERWRLLKRRMRVNQLTLPLLARYPGEYVHFHPARYFRYLVERRPAARPILEIQTPYFQFQAFRALNFHGAM